MLDDFFVRALLAAAGVACIAAPVGCVLLWRRMAYFGDTMAHSALLGVALGAVLGLGLGVGVFGVAIAVALLLIVLERTAHLATDSLLGVLSHTTLALGIVVLALSASSYRHDLIGFLFGDVLAVNRLGPRRHLGGRRGRPPRARHDLARARGRHPPCGSRAGGGHPGAPPSGDLRGADGRDCGGGDEGRRCTADRRARDHPGRRRARALSRTPEQMAILAALDRGSLAGSPRPLRIALARHTLPDRRSWSRRCSCSFGSFAVLAHRARSSRIDRPETAVRASGGRSRFRNEEPDRLSRVGGRA